MKAKVLKRVTNNGKTLEVGEIVDVSGWRNAKSLASNRYIAFVQDEPEVAIKNEPVAKPKAKSADKLSADDK